ncbi:MAG TPA: efflux RND transporter periplasmic adaptor subunit [Fimbriiglobus sp.]|nr:efflux RND transporter periplasmic adaptor subunit [Fimbriiglobus sp.]
MNTPSAILIVSRIAAVVLARARFVLLVGALLGVLAAWPFLRNTWDKLTQAAPTGGAVSSATEYWCPMCPGVVSDWPTKCPVCNMTLVRRQKGEMTPLPDGVVARVQLSPYRLLLAGVRTVPVEFRRLEAEATVAGRLEAPADALGSSPPLTLAADVFERDAAGLQVGQQGAVVCDASPGETYTGRITEIVPATNPASGRRVRVQVDNPRGDLRPGLYAAATFRTPVAHFDSAGRYDRDRWRDRVAAGAVAGPDAALATLADAAVRHVLAREGLTLCVPEPTVIDTGDRRVVYVESMSGMFDAVEVRLGRRCGGFYPVVSGLEPGQRVAAAGAVLLDAETRLNPNVAASYFGAAPRAASPPPAPESGSSSDEDRLLVERQKVCPVTGEPLDAMGGPVKVVVDGRTVFVCCKSCEKPLRAKADQYLSKLPK